MLPVFSEIGLAFESFPILNTNHLIIWNNNPIENIANEMYKEILKILRGSPEIEALGIESAKRIIALKKKYLGA